MLADVTKERSGRTGTVAVFVASDIAGLTLRIHSLSAQEHSHVNAACLSRPAQPVKSAKVLGETAQNIPLAAS